MRGLFEVHIDGRIIKGENLITNQGLDHILNRLFFATGGATPRWGLIDSAGFTAIAAGDTMALHGGWSEITVGPTNPRETWNLTAASNGQMNNNATPRTIPFSAGVSIQGLFIVVGGSSARGSTTGFLWSAFQIPGAPVVRSSGTTIEVKYNLIGN